MKKTLIPAIAAALVTFSMGASAATTNFLFVAGGREASAASAGITPADTLANINSGSDIDFINVLVADVDTGAKTVDNWRIAGVLPATHPDGGDVQWSYLGDSVNVYNNRLYVGPGEFNGSGSVVANFVAYADIASDGTLSAFQTSPRFPAPTPNQAIVSTQIVEAGGTAYYYVLGASDTTRILYAPIDSGTGAVGSWTATTTPLPVADWFNGAIDHQGKLINVRGNLGTTRSVDYADISVTGDITGSFTNLVYDVAAAARWDYGVTKTVSGGNTFLHILGGNTTADGALDQVHFSQLDNTTGVPGAFALDATPLPAPRRRMTAAAADDMIVIPGGSSTTSFTLGTSTVFIGSVASNGAVTWATSPTPISSNGTDAQVRSFHGAAIAPLPPPPLSVPHWMMY